MAIRLKCKCGTSLKISAKLAGKKVNCPSCDKPFRIPIERFEAAEAARRRAAAKRGATPHATVKPGEQDIPSPPDERKSSRRKLDLKIGPVSFDEDVARRNLELGLTPGRLDPEEQADDTSGMVDWASSSMLDDLASEAAGAVAPAAVGKAGDPEGSSPRRKIAAGDAIQGPKRGFWTDAFRAFIFPVMSGGNISSFLSAAFLAAILAAIQIGLIHVGMSLPRLVWPIVFVVVVCVCGWLAGICMSTVLESAAGSDDLPGISVGEGVLDDVLTPLVKFFGSFVVAFSPFIVWAIAIGLDWAPSSWAALLPVWALVGAFITPMFLLLFSFGAGGMAIRPDLVFLTIIRTIPPYLAMWLMLLLVAFAYLVSMGSGLLATIGLQDIVPNFDALGMAGPAVAFIIDIYLTLVAMRIVGLYYLHFKNRFAIVME